MHQPRIAPATFDIGQSIYACPTCGQLLDVRYDWDRLALPAKLSDFQARWADRSNRLNFSGVWRFRELLPFPSPTLPQGEGDVVVTIGEGQTAFQQADELAVFLAPRPGDCSSNTKASIRRAVSRTMAWPPRSPMPAWSVHSRWACTSTGNTFGRLCGSAAHCGMKALGVHRHRARSRW